MKPWEILESKLTLFKRKTWILIVWDGLCWGKLGKVGVRCLRLLKAEPDFLEV